MHRFSRLHHAQEIRGLAAAALLLAAAACAAPVTPAPVPAPTPTPAPAPTAGLPPVPEVDGPLAIRVVHPTPATPKPAVARSFVFGSVGNGRATLTIDGAPVPVAPNGAFLAYLPVPASGVYQLEATLDGRSTSTTAPYQAPAAGAGAPSAPVTTTELTRPLAARVVRGADTLATGSDAAIGRPTPTGTYRWFLPRGAQVAITARRGTQLRARLGGTDAWFDAADFALGAELPPSTGAAALSGVRVSSAARWVDLRLPVGGAPFLVDTDAAGRSLTLTLYGVTPPAAPGSLTGDAMLAGATWDAGEAGSARLTLSLASRLWGYKAWYDADGGLILRLRRPPMIDAASPLRGVRIAIDPGHPPAGATGPTGLTEAEANLNVALPLARQLREQGAEVMLTRDANVPVALGDRTALAAAWDADLLVSVHNNAFAEGANPFLENGTSTYYFYPFSRDLARALDAAIVDATRIRDIGARSSNLALVRITWMPSTLTESLFMMIPEQEAALRDPAFLERLAAAHVSGIARFLGDVAAGR